jgi:hypothetical protein
MYNWFIAANKQEQHETMTSRITRQNAISWQQFTERDREQRNAVSKTTAVRNEKETNDMSSYDDAPTPRSERYKRWIAAKSSSSETAQAIRKCVKIMTAANTKQTKQTNQPAQTKQQPKIAAATTETFEPRMQVRTRAQRKAAANEPEITPIQPEVLPKQKKEQRTDYWATRDDKRRQSARLLKLKRIEQIE